MSRKDSKYRGSQCLNCKTPLDLSEKYCHYCGQLNSTKKITLSDFIEEFFSNFYAYDSKLRNSIVSIFTKPGILAKRYNEGQRTTYANPFRLFLSISIILFISFNLTEGDYEESKNNEQDLKFETSNDSILSETTFLGKSEIKKIKDLHSDSIYSEKTLEENCQNSFKLLKFKTLTFRNFHLKKPLLSTENALDSLKFKKDRVNKFLYSKAKTFKTTDIEDEILDYFYEKLPFILFLTIPILTLIFWIVFYKKTLNYTEHLVFVYTFYTFIFIVILFINIIDLFQTEIVYYFAFTCFFILFPYYLYRSLRNFYQFSRWKTIFKLVLLHPLFALIMLIAIILSIALGILIK